MMRCIVDWARRAGSTSLVPVSLTLSHARTNSSSIQAPDPFGVKSHLTYDKAVTSRGPFRSSGGGFHGTVPRLAPKGKATTGGGKPKTLEEFLEGLGHNDELSKLKAQKIFTVDDLRSVIKGLSQADAVNLLTGKCGLSVKAASDVYNELQKPDLSSLHLPTIPDCRSPQKYYARAESLNKAEAYLEGVLQLTDAGFNATTKKGKLIEKFSLFGSSGMKGIGKTEFLKHVARYRVPKLAKKLKRSIGVLYISFNGSMTESHATTFAELTEGSGKLTYAAALAQILLQECGGPEPSKDRKVTLRQALTWIRGSRDALVIFVDEVGELRPKISLEVMKILMRECDSIKNRGKIAFIFAHINQNVLEKGATGSGRKCDPVALPSLPLDIWRKQPVDGLPPASRLRRKASKSPPLTQLLLSLSGHPRSVFDGLPAAFREEPLLLTTSTASKFQDARKRIITETKLNTVTTSAISSAVAKWLARDPLDEQRLIFDGLLHQVQSHPNVRFLFPLHVQNWATKESGNLALAFHLSEMYSNDAGLGPGSEKAMEGVMMNFEAALRLAFGEQRSFQLDEYYRVQPKDPSLHARLFKLKIPSTKVSNVAAVHSLNKAIMDNVVLRLLQRGSIVTSDNSTEKGLEYLVPFFDAFSGKLVVACVQCKFVQENVDWQQAGKMMEEAMKYFKAKGIEHFPVYFTTVDQSSTWKSTLDDSVLLLEEDIFEMTHRLGILRLHCMKLGKHLTKKYRCRADESRWSKGPRFLHSQDRWRVDPGES